MTDDDERRKARKMMQKRFSKQRGRVWNTVDQLARFVTLSNGGGALAVLGFLGSAQSFGPRPATAVAALMAFGLGLCFSGAGVLRQFAIRSGSAELTLATHTQLWEDTDAHVVAKDHSVRASARVAKNKWLPVHYFFVAAYALFVIGVLCGIWAILPV